MERKIIILMCFISSIICCKLYAQKDELRDKIENIKLEKMTAKLSLEEPVKTNFIDKYKSFSKDMRGLVKNRAKVYRAITENVETGDGMDSLVSQLLDYESQISKKRLDFIADLQTLLTSQQIAKMIIFERKFNNEIKKILKEYQKENKKEFKE
jgi:hypothetical protein